MEVLMDQYGDIQLHAVEVSAVYDGILRTPGCKLLVFGLGRDSPLWCRLNPSGRTAFIEDSPDWYERARVEYPSIECYLVAYGHRITQWKDLLESPDALELALPNPISRTEWDVILVDAPAGYSGDDSLPGRMSSIYMASKLVKRGGSVFVHDAERPLESAYCKKYLGEQNLVKSVSGRAQLNEYRAAGTPLPQPDKAEARRHVIPVSSWNNAMYSGYLVLSVDPVILIYTGTYQEQRDTIIPDSPADVRPDVVIEMLSLWMSPAYAKRIAERYDRRNDGVHRMVMANAPDEDRNRIAHGIDGFHCNKEIFALESVFRPQPVIQAYNAIYVARLENLKRHRLARRVKHLRLLTGGKGKSDFRTGLARAERRDLERMALHETVSASFESLNPYLVSREINTSACGLALSETEGMMRASTQYLLCGKPVVSTHSRGGRDAYYDDLTAILVHDDEEAVWDAVKTLVTDRRDPEEIRRRTLNRIYRYRYDFARQVGRIRDRFGGDHVSPERIFHDLFFSVNRNYMSRHIAGGAALRADLQHFAYATAESDCFRMCTDRFRLVPAGPAYCLVTDGGVVVAKLQDSAAWILTRLDGNTSVKQLVEELGARFGNEPDLAEDTRDAIAHYIELGALHLQWNADVN